MGFLFLFISPNSSFCKLKTDYLYNFVIFHGDVTTMAWLQRLFGLEAPEDAQVNPDENLIASNAPEGETIPIERAGLNGEFDQSGLAKRVALAFDLDGRFDDINTLYVAQLGTIVVLKGEVPSQDILDEFVAIARDVNGASDVQTDEVTIG